MARIARDLSVKSGIPVDFTISGEDTELDRNVVEELLKAKSNRLGLEAGSRVVFKNKKKRKLIDYLMYRGWESHLIYDKVNELIK